MILMVIFAGSMTVLAIYNAQGNDPVVAVAGDQKSVWVTVQNKVLGSASDFKEDRHLLYLSTRRISYCAYKGCSVAGFTAGSGVKLLALCFAAGSAMTNVNLWSLSARRNPHRASSNLWYYVRAGAAEGWVNEVYLTPASRGGLGLRHCDPSLAR